MKKLRDVQLRYCFAAPVFGGISLFLFGVVFALLRQVDHRIEPNPAWAWVLAALIALVAAAGAFFALVAWGALSDPKSRLGSWVQEKYLPDAVLLLCSEGLMWGGFFLILWGGSYSIYIGAVVGVAVLLCWVLFFRRVFKLDIKALDDPRPNRLIGKRRERGSYDDQD